MPFCDTIVACATGQQNAALSIIRTSGNNVFDIVSPCVLEQVLFQKAEPFHIHCYTFVDKNSSVLDEVTIIKYLAPKSYTGDNLVEIICHGNMLIVNKIIETLIDAGARLAEGGEFTKRAFLNGKVSLTKSEAINQIISTKTEASYKNSINSFAGKDSAFFEQTKAELVELLSFIENQLEFSDFQDKEALTLIDSKTSSCIENIAIQILGYTKTSALEEYPPVAIVGIPNAGKSSLMNLVLGHARSIVHNTNGTTRDFVSEKINLNSYPVTLIDTAGICSTNDEVEKIGIEHTFSIMNSAPLVIWVSPADMPFQKEELSFTFSENQSVVAIISKFDLDNGQSKRLFFEDKKIPFVEICLQSTNERDRLLAFLSRFVSSAFSSPVNHICFINSKRQAAILKAVKAQLDATLSDSRLETKSFYINNALELFEEIFGRFSSEDLINKVFEGFCVGK